MKPALRLLCVLLMALLCFPHVVLGAFAAPEDDLPPPDLYLKGEDLGTPSDVLLLPSDQGAYGFFLPHGADTSSLKLCFDASHSVEYNGKALKSGDVVFYNNEQSGE